MVCASVTIMEGRNVESHSENQVPGFGQPVSTSCAYAHAVHVQSYRNSENARQDREDGVRAVAV